MSADNGLLIKKYPPDETNGYTRYVVHEYCASITELPSEMHSLETCENLEDAVKFAEKYMKENIVEYGIEFEIS